ncbi:MAG TPA: phosphatase PAP2 family protein [Rhodanobacteraceae bacterium]|nr:phosphatase PAP2 family protein [Rhodanobacteraceae bacterium]
MNTLVRAPRPDRQGFESELCRRANYWGARQGIGSLFRVVSKLGDGWFWYALMALFAGLGGDRGRHAAAQMLATGWIAWLLYKILKRCTRRPRPFHANTEVVAHVPPLDEYSFPSGHTMHAVGFSVVAIAWFPQLAIPLIAFSVLVALSRVVLGLHYPSDVLAGIAIGAVLGAGSLAAQSVWFPT